MNRWSCLLPAAVSAFVDKLVANPALIAKPELAFLRDGLAKLGIKMPAAAAAEPKPAASTSSAAGQDKPKASPAPAAEPEDDDDLEPKEFVWTGNPHLLIPRSS
jgi:hypothetical protein